jgi:hypothetical protein
MTRALIKALPIAMLVPLSVAVPALAQEGEDGAFDRTPQDCVVVASIDQTKAIDDQTLIFRMRGDRVYRNSLPRKCPGLARENRIAYETRVGRLCSIDTITVLERLGVGFTPGFTCRLGEFVPLSPDEIEDLETIAEGRQRAQSAAEATEVELDDEESEEAEAPAAPAVEDSANDAEN